MYARAIISRGLDIGREALIPGIAEAPETGYPKLVLVRISLHLT